MTAILGPNCVRCTDCGVEQAVAMPCSMNVYTAIFEAFEKDHGECELTDAGRARYEYSDPHEWVRSWDTGRSALVIYRVAIGVSLTYGDADLPHDPADFGRCARLLAVCQNPRDVLAAIRLRHKNWIPLIDAWPELTVLYEEAVESGDPTPKLYRRMQELLA